MIAAQEKKAGANGRNRKNLHLTDINAIANSTNSSLMQTQYSKGPFEAPLAGVSSNLGDQKARASKLKMKMTNSPDLGQEPMRYKH